jgi:phage shock protein PspC (stress-responsive transcriptional regulator)
MNKVIAIHLNGTAFQLEEAGYEALRSYLDNAARQLADNPDHDEILADIEQAIADKCRALLSGYRTVILTREIEQVIAEMGPVDGGRAGAQAAAGAQSSAGGAANDPGQGPTPEPSRGGSSGVRRVYRIYEGAMISGVCNGIAAYFGIDPSIVRFIFIMLAFVTFGGMILAYFALVLLLPAAETPAEKAAAQGIPATAQEFIRRAREGYYDAARAFGGRRAHREWRKRFHHEMRRWRRSMRHDWQASSAAWQGAATASWTQHPGAWQGLWFSLSVLSLIRSVLTVVFIYALVMLASHGAVFGLAKPADMPLWVALLILCVIFQAVMWPFRAARHALKYHGWGTAPSGPAIAVFSFWDSLVSLAVFALLLWLADRYVPHFHEALMHLPQWIQSFVDSVKDWWAHRQT